MTDRAARTELIQARVLEEQRWAYNHRIRGGLEWEAIRALALRPKDAGGLDRNLSLATLRDMVAAHRAAQGEIVGTREERIERRQLELDHVALLARETISGEIFMPDLRGLEADPDDDTKTAIAKARARASISMQAQAAAARYRGDAAKLLLDTRAAEAKMHGDDAAQRVDVEVTTRTRLDAEIDAMLERLPAAEAADRKDA